MKICHTFLILCGLILTSSLTELNAGKCQPIGTVRWRVVHPRNHTMTTWISKELEHLNTKLDRIACESTLFGCEATQAHRSAAIRAANEGISQEEINAKMGELGYKWSGDWQLDNGGTTGLGACVIRGKK